MCKVKLHYFFLPVLTDSSALLLILVPTKEVPFLTEKSLLSNLNSCVEEGSYKKLVHNIGIVFCSSESLNKSFLLDSTTKQNTGTSVDIEAVRRMYSALFKTGDSSVENSLINSLVALSPTLEMELRYKSPSSDPNFLNQFVIIMENTMLQSPEYLDQALPSFLKAIALLPVKQQASLVHIWSQFTSQEIRRMVETLQQLITYQVLTGPCATGNAPVQEDEAIVAATKTMKLLYYASIMGGTFDQTCLSDSRDGAMGSDNHDDPLVKELKIDVQDCRKLLLKPEEFINDPLNDQIEVDRDYTYYKHEKGVKFSFLKYNFILSTATKSLGLFYDNRIRMYSERRLTILYSLVRGEQGTPYLKLKVRRDHLIEDALVNVSIQVKCALLPGLEIATDWLPMQLKMLCWDQFFRVGRPSNLSLFSSVLMKKLKETLSKKWRPKTISWQPKFLN